MKTGAVIAAAGLSSRMGVFKPLLPLKDSSVIRCCVETFINTDCHPVIVVTGYKASLLEDHLSDLPVEFVFNSRFDRSDMFASVKLGLKAIYGRCSQVFFTPGDIPAVRPETLQRLLSSGSGAVRPVFEQKPGHPILFPGTLIPEILAYTGNMGLKGAFRDLGIRFRNIDASDPGILLDADTPRDYDVLKQYADTADY